MPSGNRGTFSSSFQVGCFISLPFYSGWSLQHSAELQCEGQHPHLALLLAVFYHQWWCQPLVFHKCSLSCWRSSFRYLVSWVFFIMKRWWILSDGFPVLSRLCVLTFYWCGVNIDFCMLNHPCVSGINPAGHGV